MAKGKALSAEDRILWGKVARTARPLPGRMDELAEFEAPAEEPTGEKLVVTGRARATAEPPASLQPEKPKRAVPVHHPLEKPVKRKLSRGHLAIEARIDLHGMVQSEAHGFLLQFLLRAHDRGLRHVLVITGKGTSFGSDGALKRAVPLWFSLPEFRGLISSYEPAARNHGGDGALYVRLSRLKGLAS
ncbi:Smr/MutS family protein [Rhizobium sp. Root482]|uniref:Smr/MutS family protein n=1 Tax=Rhizobium sp. Root482 TaxID=1736543 RepID=UPI0006F24E35|nr:Smr/MutS family protein [Rhizobium sp. Root482]KQY25840.1 DNA mismatch repair protein MutS [Rhizobium sp. Root482]